MRRRRKLSNTGLYHVVIRGVNKQNIFYDKDDKYLFLDLLKKYSKKYEIRIHAYCLMDNHVHILIEDGNKNISIFMQSICSLYARKFNRKYDRIGHLFQERFASEVIETDEYFKTVFRYIIQNPEIAGICKSSEYFWSSYRYYYIKNELIINSKIQSYFENRKTFCKFMDSKSDASCLEIEMRPSEKEYEYISKIKKILGTNNPIINPDIPKNKLIPILRKMKDEGLSVRTISRVTGIGKYLVQNA